MEKYRARNNNNERIEVPEKSEKEKKQESTEKAVDLAAETALDYFTGGKGSSIKNAAGNIPIIGNKVNKTWDNAVKGVSKVVSKTPAGDVLKKADDTGITDAARSVKNVVSPSKGSNVNIKTNGNSKSSNVQGVNNNSNNSKMNKSSKFSILGKGNTDKKGTSDNIAGTIWKKLPKGVKIKIAVGCMVCLLFLMMVYTVFAQDDITNLELTNSSSMSIKAGNVGSLANGLETVAMWYIENVNTYQTLTTNESTGHRKYYQTPFGTRKFGDDCTEFATAFMSYVAGVDLPESYSGEMVYPDGTWAQTVGTYGWKAYSSDEIGSLQTGDVLIAHVGSLYSTAGQHAEVYVDDSHTFGWGSIKNSYPTSNTITTTNSGGHTHFLDSEHDYITVYRYEGSLSGGTNSVDGSNLNMTKMNDASFNHGTKPKTNQKYIVLHDTEMSQDAETVVESWKNSNKGVAAHFVVDRDGTIVQAVDLDVIAHHAGPGGPGNYDEKFGVGNNDGKGNGDDLIGNPTGTGNYANYTSYGMNSYSIGIEMCHVNGEEYPSSQLDAVDKVIAYIDSYYGFNSTIIDHKEWRPSNSDTDSKFSTYLNNYKTLRHH